MESRSQSKTSKDIQAWLVAQVAAELRIDPLEIDVDKPLTRCGLDSMAAVVLAGEMEIWLGRSLPPDLLEEYPSIIALSRHLASEHQPSSSSPEAGLAPDNSNSLARHVDFQSGRLERVFSKLIVFLSRFLIRLHVEGKENFPGAGPFILAANHLHVMDPVLIYPLLPKGTAFLVAEDMRKKWPIIEWIMRQLGQAIYVARGEADRQAISRAVGLLRAGGRLAMAPEGKVSRTGGLLQGRTGIAYLATQAGVPVLPVVAFGQERAGEFWKRLRRVPVQIRVGSLVQLPAGKAGAKELEAYTEMVMVAMTQLLPQQYRGVYAQATEKEQSCGSVIAPAS
ncbi:MAG: 1-acyl-sn-glycerol-3-phosphate acyltransferase [Acidobacteria bacterium]|nr:1-acyl-sn-glycerol-3-phosphate acyltransferase [Acidobacteriota bacterium]